MFLVQLFLPLRNNEGQPFSDRGFFDEVRAELINCFGGVTDFLRSPADGAGKHSHGKTNHDEIVIFEVITESVDRSWWAEHRKTLTRRFRQEDLIILCSVVERL